GRYKVLCCVNASYYSVDKNGEDIYMGEALINFFNKNTQYGLIFSDPTGYYTEHFYTGQSNILMISSPHDFVNIIKLTDIFIRATLQDGDSLSIKEALFYEKKVIATNCVDRPQGVLTF